MQNGVDIEFFVEQLQLSPRKLWTIATDKDSKNRVYPYDP